MKQSIRLFCLAATAFFASQRAHAQIKPFSFGVYAEAGFPTGDMNTTQVAGYGVGVGTEVKLPAKLAATGSFGFMHFGGKERSAGSNSYYPALNAFPLRIGAKYRFKIVYLGLETGAVFQNKNQGSAGLIAPAVGVHFLNIDIRGKYESWFDSQKQFWGVQAMINL